MPSKRQRKGRRGSSIECAARKILRYLSEMKLARALGNQAMPLVTEIQQVENDLIAPVSEERLRKAMLRALQFIDESNPVPPAMMKSHCEAVTDFDVIKTTRH